MRKAQEYRDHARRCELLLEKVTDPRVRQQLRRERQEWLELAASSEAALRNERWTGERPLDQDMTLAALRAFEANRRMTQDTISCAVSPKGEGETDLQPYPASPHREGIPEAMERVRSRSDPRRDSERPSG